MMSIDAAVEFVSIYTGMAVTYRLRWIGEEADPSIFKDFFKGQLFI